eukprot:58366_1
MSNKFQTQKSSKLEMSTDYKHLNENDSHQPIDLTNVQTRPFYGKIACMLKKTQQIQRNEESQSERRKQFWFRNTIYVQSIDINQQNFSIKGVFNIYWNDNDLINHLNQLQEDIKIDNDSNQNDDNDIIMIPFSNLSDSIKNILPVNQAKLFENSKHIQFIKEPTLKYLQKGKTNLFCIVFKIDATFYQSYNVKEYPFDNHLLNIKLYYDVNEFYYTREPNKSEMSISFKQLDSSEWKLQSDIPPFIQFNLCELKSQTRWQYGVISLPVKRYYSHFMYSVLIPLFIIISCSFSIYSIDYSEYILRIALLFLCFVVVSILNTIASQMDIPKWYQSMSFVSTYFCIAYIILALMMAESIIVGMSTSTNRKTLKIIEIIFGFCMGIPWLVFGVVNFYNIAINDSKQHWESKSKNQLTKWRDDVFTYGYK